MATATGPLGHKQASAVRPGISNLQQTTRPPSSPHTPVRTLSSTYSSPAYGFRAEEEVVVFEFGARYISAGLAGESAPRCKLGFDPEQSRRVGDYRQWLPGYESRAKEKNTSTTWGKDHELWRLDLRDLNLGLFDDKIERIVRKAYIQHLLLASKSKRVVLVLPSLMPLPLLSSLISCLFNNFQMPGITMLPAPTMAVVSAGLRSAIVVDIGWHETSISAIYEFREVFQRKTTRAMSLVTDHMRKMLQKVFDDTEYEQTQQIKFNKALNEPTDVEFIHAEEVTSRFAWCETSKGNTNDIEQRLESINIARDTFDKDNPATGKSDRETLVSIPLISSSSKAVDLPFSAFQKPVETALLASKTIPYDLDDQEQPIPFLLYKALLSLPPDVRGICMARIVITGGGSEIPGLKSRIVSEVSAMVKQRGWDPVWGRAADKYRGMKAEIARKNTEDNGQPPKMASPPVPAALEPQVPDPIEDKLKRKEVKLNPVMDSGVIRGVETLGAWVGASLVAKMKVKGIVEIERDVFLQHGLAGAKREMEGSVAQARQSSFGPGIQRAAGAEKAGWTLGAWA